MWEGIEELVVCLERMACGTAEPCFYLSSLDPGVGKTQTLLHFLLALSASPEHQHVGAVVFVLTKAEIANLVHEAKSAGLSDKDFAVRVHKDDEELNSLGCANPEQARILFTTHGRLLTICTDRSFASVREFNYRGLPRQVRVWDERLLPADAVALGNRHIAGLYPHLTQGLVDDLDQLRDVLKGATDKQVICVPNLADKYDLSSSELRWHLREMSSTIQKTAADLWSLFGKSAIVRHDDANERKLVSYRETLPPDFAPIVVLDASGRVATTYEWWERDRGNLVRLKDAPKRYDKLALHVWSIGGGASSFNGNGGALRRSGIVQAINSKPNEE